MLLREVQREAELFTNILTCLLFRAQMPGHVSHERWLF